MRYLVITCKLRLIALCLLPLTLAACPQAQRNVGSASQQQAENQPTADEGVDGIGSLGGIPIRFSGYITHGPMSYEDTPTIFSPDWENYKSPSRTLKSPIDSFGIDVNLDTGKVFDNRTDSFSDRSEERKIKNSPWASVNFYTTAVLDFLNSYLDDDVRAKPKLPEYTFKKTGEVQYGLEVYEQLEPDSNTGSTDTLFIARDKKGNVSSYIKCSNNDVPNPPCEHKFLWKMSPYVYTNAGYSRYRLKDWQKIEARVQEILAEFADNAKHPERKL
ncbi:MAG: hypothetical protein Q4A84_08660 [Neisseria sp.]|uniref:hypothetical protein n=1 Tax=Neisseria sp. TaxID=192066 RepID=UPI0026DB7513|nr:hypothetical protein [Neisseria sp.]MDO4641749.1 hypothetical protein [Neisseria sp.]